jgi:DNA repair protein RecO (recombination protein O)
MKRGGSQRLEAVVLRITPYGEADAIVGLLTDLHGRISAFAPGARKSAKRFGGSLDLFARVRAEVTPPRGVSGTLWRLTGLDLIDLHLALRRDLSRYANAAYLSECLWSLAGEGHPDARLFAWWERVLKDLSDPALPREREFDFDLELLALLGFAPRWDRCADCGAIPSGERIFFSFVRGGVACDRCRRAGEGTWLDARAVRRVAEGLPPPLDQREAFRRAIDAFVCHTLGRPPRSQAFRQEVLRAGF